MQSSVYAPGRVSHGSKVKGEDPDEEQSNQDLSRHKAWRKTLTLTYKGLEPMPHGWPCGG